MDFSRFSCARMRARDVEVPLRSYHCGNDPARGTRAWWPAIQPSRKAILRARSSAVMFRAAAATFASRSASSSYVIGRFLWAAPWRRSNHLSFMPIMLGLFTLLKSVAFRVNQDAAVLRGPAQDADATGLCAGHFRRLSFTTTLAGISVNARLRSRRTLAGSVEACNALSIAERAMPLASEAPWAIRPA
jgi:hypothetical protein